MRRMLWTLIVAGAAILATSLVTDWLHGTEIPTGIDLATPPDPDGQGSRSTGSAPPTGLLEHPAAAPTRPAVRSPIGSDHATDDWQRGGEDIASSPRITVPPAAPSSEPRTETTPGLAVTALCARAGSPCGSSADCCPGLACDGGVAGYGISGRCT